MPSKAHELPLEMFRRQPLLAPELLRTCFGLTIPDTDKVSLGSETYPETDPAEYRCDATVMVGDPCAPSLGIVVETQLRFSQRKTFTWPVYLAALRARRECSVTLLVLCPDEATARACAAPIEMGHPGWILQPLTVSPHLLPAVTDLQKARELPELAILGTAFHADGPDAVAVLNTYCQVVQDLPTETAAKYRDYVESLFSDSARKLLEEIVSADTYEYTSKFARHHMALGEAKALLLVLAARDIEITDEQRRQILECSDTSQLERWLQQSASVKNADQLFT